MPKAKVSLKDELFNVDTVSILANSIKSVYETLDEQIFIEDIVSNFNNLELKARINWISKMIDKHLPSSFQTTVNILKDSLSKTSIESMFAFAAYPEYVSIRGCTKEDLNLSLYMLGEFTKRFSAEFAIRDFINMFPEETYNIMLEWSKSKNVHQRRLASEGLRPKLPWALGINFDYKKGCLPLHNLFNDKERYVTRSVANHLNDISKIDPELVLSILNKWKESNKQESKEMEYIISHSLRTLVKKGHKGTLEFLGYGTSPKIDVLNLTIKNQSIKIGDSIEFSFEIIGKGNEELIVDYKVIYPMANTKKSEKVFKIKKLSVKKDSSTIISKKHAFRVMTTKKLYSGNYVLIIQINGNEYGREDFFIQV